MRHDLVPARELAFRIAAAAEEDFPAPAAPFEDLTLLAIRAGDARAHRLGARALDAVAIGIARASEEFAEARAPPHHRLAAFLADLVGDGRRGRFLRHHFALIVALELTGVGALGVVRAGEKFAVAAPFDHHVAAVEFALEVGLEALALDLGHQLFGRAEAFFERPVKALERLDPVLAPLFDVVEFRSSFAVKPTSRMSGKAVTSRSQTTRPSEVGRSRLLSSSSTYSRFRMLAMIEA